MKNNLRFKKKNNYVVNLDNCDIGVWLAPHYRRLPRAEGRLLWVHLIRSVDFFYCFRIQIFIIFRYIIWSVDLF